MFADSSGCNCFLCKKNISVRQRFLNRLLRNGTYTIQFQQGHGDSARCQQLTCTQTFGKQPPIGNDQNRRSRTWDQIKITISAGNLKFLRFFRLNPSRVAHRCGPAALINCSVQQSPQLIKIRGCIYRQPRNRIAERRI